MADTKTSAEAAATALTGAELFRLVQGGADKQTTAARVGHQFRGARVRMTLDDTAQNITGDTPVSFDQADFDTDTFWSLGAPTRLTIPAGLGIDYVELIGQVYITSAAADTVFAVGVWHYNSSDTLQKIMGCRFVEGGNAARMGQATTGPVAVADGDYFVLNALTETDTSVTIEGNDNGQTYMTIKVVGMTP